MLLFQEAFTTLRVRPCDLFSFILWGLVFGFFWGVFQAFLFEDLFLLLRRHLRVEIIIKYTFRHTTLDHMSRLCFGFILDPSTRLHCMRSSCPLLFAHWFYTCFYIGPCYIRKKRIGKGLMCGLLIKIKDLCEKLNIILFID